MVDKNHSCEYKNKNGTSKLSNYDCGENCILPAKNSYWRLVKKIQIK